MTPSVAIEIAPFVGIVLLELTSAGFPEKFKRRIDGIEDDGAELGVFREDLEHAAYQSFEYESAVVHYQYGIVATVIIFVSKLVAVSQSAIVGLFGLVAVLLELLLLNLTKRYFQRRPPNKYWIDDYIGAPLGTTTYRVHYGKLGVVVANLIPIAFLLYLN